MPLRKAIEYGVQMARGLAAAHDEGLVHRDLKPENIFILADGHVVLDTVGGDRNLSMGVVLNWPSLLPVR